MGATGKNNNKKIPQQQLRIEAMQLAIPSTGRPYPCTVVKTMPRKPFPL